MWFFCTCVKGKEGKFRPYKISSASLCGGSAKHSWIAKPTSVSYRWRHWHEREELVRARKRLSASWGSCASMTAKGQLVVPRDWSSLKMSWFWLIDNLCSSVEFARFGELNLLSGPSLSQIVFVVEKNSMHSLLPKPKLVKASAVSSPVGNKHCGLPHHPVRF